MYILHIQYLFVIYFKLTSKNIPIDITHRYFTYFLKLQIALNTRREDYYLSEVFTMEIKFVTDKVVYNSSVTIIDFVINNKQDFDTFVSWGKDEALPPHHHSPPR